MKGLEGETGEMKIHLNTKFRPIIQIPYRLNPIYKEKLKKQINKMLEESEWIGPMVVQEKKKGGINIFIYLRKLNDSCLHYPFPTSFTDKVLENLGGQ
jgi:DNA gyrase/topoisomerase IV subunit A